MNKPMSEEKAIRRATIKFWSRVEQRPTGCLEWVGLKSHAGYGILSVRGRHVAAHRFSWQIHYGDIPHDGSRRGIFVLHKCDNPSCVNPDHLFLGTHADNMRDMASKGRAAFAQSGIKLSQKEVADIKRIVSVPSIFRPSYREIAKQFGVSYNTVYLIKNGKIWKNV